MKRIDDLQCKGLVLVQDDSKYCFTTDAVLLANFAKVKRKDVVVELCAGSGVISTLIIGKQNPEKIFAIELQKDCCDLFSESIKINGHQEKIAIINAPLQDANQYIDRESIDVVVVNPPYYLADQAQNVDKAIAVSTHEIALSIEDVFKVSASLLKFGGKFFMVHHVDRLAELIYKMKECKLEPKQLRFVQPKPNTNANLVLIEAVKGGKVGLKVQDVLVMRNESGEETETLKRIYERSK